MYELSHEVVQQYMENKIFQGRTSTPEMACDKVSTMLCSVLYTVGTKH